MDDPVYVTWIILQAPDDLYTYLICSWMIQCIYVTGMLHVYVVSQVRDIVERRTSIIRNANYPNAKLTALLEYFVTKCMLY